MKTANFRFSPGAQLYVKHLEVVNGIRNSKSADAKHLRNEYADVIKAMREEAYQSVGEFADAFLLQLAEHPWGDKGLCLRGKKTYSVKSYSGARINYRWLEGADERRKQKTPFECEVGKIYFGSPVWETICNLDDDSKVRTAFGIFNPLASSSLRVVIGYEGSDAQEKARVLAIAKGEDLGKFEEEREDSCSVQVVINSDDPAGSAAEQIRKLLLALYRIRTSRAA